MATKNYICDSPHIRYTIGENGHSQYDWSNELMENILQFTFQSVRSSPTELMNLQSKLFNILEYINQLDNSSQIYYMTILLKYIAYNRDIKDGKGECKLTYMMIFTVSLFHLELSYYLIDQLVCIENGHSLGSWKDIKYLCRYCLEYECIYPEEANQLIDYCVK